MDLMTFQISWTYILMGITIAVSLYAMERPEVTSKLIFNPYVIQSRGQYYRFITCALIHKDHMHLIFNMIALYFFGQAVEMVFNTIFGGLGAVYFIALYILAVIVSVMPTFFKFKGSPWYNSLGASGGVSAIVFAFILFMPLEEICVYFIICLRGFILGAIYLIYSYYEGKRGKGNINHEAHLYGALFGVLFCAVLYPPSIQLFLDQVKQYRLF